MAKGIQNSIDVWLVEDDTSFRQTVSFVVDHTDGLRVDREFEDCESAIAAADDGHKASVVLLDIGLPGMDGIKGIRALKERMPRARIVMLTMFDDAERIFGAFKEGASGYLPKDSSVEQIIGGIREAAEGGMLMPAGVADKVRNHLFQPDPSQYGLTDRERDVLEAMCDGLSQKEVAERLFVSPHTVNTHIQHIYEKMHVRSGLEAVTKAFRDGLVR